MDNKPPKQTAAEKIQARELQHAQDLKTIEQGTEAVNAILARIGKAAPQTAKNVEESTVVNEEGDKENDKSGKLREEYYEKAKEHVLSKKNASFSSLSRGLKISQKDARKLLDMMEEEGIVGPSENGVGPREFLGDKKTEIEKVLNEDPDEIDNELEAEINRQKEIQKIQDEIAGKFPPKDKDTEDEEVEVNNPSQENEQPTEKESNQTLIKIKNAFVNSWGTAKEKINKIIFGNKKEEVIQNEGPKETQELTEEMLLNRLGNLEQLAQNKLESSNSKSQIIKGLDKWENFGVGEEGMKGFGKRMTKNAINLALIGLISSFAVDQLAEAGIGSATALGGGVLSYTGRKMAIGLGFAAAFDRTGSKFKMNNKVKKAMPWIIGIGSVTAATLLSGGMVGVASGTGMVVSKLLKKQFTNEKIEAREAVAKEKLLNEIRKSGSTIETDKLEKYENEYAKILRKYENQKIWGKIADGAARLTLASTVSALTLEVSGITKDHLHEHSAETNNKIEKEDHAEKPNTKPENSNEVKPEVKPGDSNVAKPETTEQNPEHLKDIIVHKGEGIEHSFIRQIEHDPKLAQELGYKGDLGDAKALHAFAGHQAHVLAIKEGYVSNTGEEVRVAEADKVGYEIKMENGHATVNEIDATGKILETHHEGDAFEKDADKGEYIENNEIKTEEVKTSGDEITNNTTPDNSYNEDPSTYLNKSQIEQITHQNSTPNTDQVDNVKEDHQDNIKKESGSDQSKETTHGQADNTHHELSNRELRQIHRIQNHNIDKIFPNNYDEQNWHEAKRMNAYGLYNFKLNEITDEYKPLYNYLHKLSEITGLKPYSGDLLHEPETNEHFINEALKEAAKIDKLKEVKL